MGVKYFKTNTPFLFVRFSESCSCSFHHWTSCSLGNQLVIIAAHLEWGLQLFQLLLIWKMPTIQWAIVCYDFFYRVLIYCIIIIFTSRWQHFHDCWRNLRKWRRHWLLVQHKYSRSIENALFINIPWTTVFHRVVHFALLENRLWSLFIWFHRF
jgi:hypothetical protein